VTAVILGSVGSRRGRERHTGSTTITGKMPQEPTLVAAARDELTHWPAGVRSGLGSTAPAHRLCALLGDRQ